MSESVVGPLDPRSRRALERQVAVLEAELDRLRELNATLRTGRNMVKEERDLLWKENQAKSLELAEKTGEVRALFRAEVERRMLSYDRSRVEHHVLRDLLGFLAD